MTERRLRARFLRKDAVLGWVALSIIIALSIIGFQFARDRNSRNDVLASEPEQVPRIGVAQLKIKIDAAASLLVVDVRSREEYQNLHIVGSISLPLEQISERYNELRGYQQVVTYCT